MLSNSTLEVARYDIRNEKLTDSPVRVVMISDLHRKKLDETNQQVVDKTALEKPDIIVVNGDMLEHDCTEEEVEAFAYLLERLCAIAPVYFSVGNHDFRAFYSEYEVASRKEYLIGTEQTDAVKRLESTGARYLERNYADIEVNGERLRIGGLYALAYPNTCYTVEQYLPILEYIYDFCDTDAFTMMLAHRPRSFAHPLVDINWNIDLILSGHTHNGVIALPFGLGAIWCASEFLPKYDRGLFDMNGCSLIIGAGIDGHRGIIPRIFNPPEIVTVDIRPK